jgi:hypothetical protein
MNPKHQAWLKGQYPGAKPPGREDVESLQVWLHQQLQLLLDSHAGTDCSNEQHPQQHVQHILKSVHPEGMMLHLQQKQQQQQAVIPAASKKPFTSIAAQSCEPFTANAAAVPDATCGSQTAQKGCGLGEWLDSTGLQAQTSQLLLAAKQPAGLLDVARLQQQEALFSAAFNELCR